MLKRHTDLLVRFHNLTVIPSLELIKKIFVFLNRRLGSAIMDRRTNPKNRKALIIIGIIDVHILKKYSYT